MTTLAITGGIGSGKSEVARMLAENPGVRVANADDEAKRLMTEDPALRAALIERFGEETFLDDGSLNRTGLAERVFSDPIEVEALNALVHPAVLDALVASIDEAREDGTDLFVYEAALLTEIGVAEVVDTVLLVDAPLETRVERVMVRNDTSREDVLARVDHQKSPDALRQFADYIIDNDGDLDDLRHAVASVYQTILIR